jgi:hypothetical protein
MVHTKALRHGIVRRNQCIFQKNFVKRLILFCLLLAALHVSFAQKDSSHIRISLLTCAPGDEMYSMFGHTALRITDSVSLTDLVYNYGTFDFEDPDFYSKFVKGKLDYFLSVAEFNLFMYEYQVTKRDVIEQELRLSAPEKQAIKNALAENLVGSNRFYKYDFLYDNCTSRVRDILEKYAGMRVAKALPVVMPGTSFRDLIHEYANRGHKGWTKLGMDLLMGAPADRKLHDHEAMFLPDYLLKGVDNAPPLLLKKDTILKTGNTVPPGSDHWPLYILGSISILALLVSFSNNKTARSFTQFLDFVLCFLTGLIGCVLLYTWFGTDHASFRSNYNLLWALPTNLVAAIFLWRRPRWLKKYFLVAALVYGLVLITWYWLPQELNTALIPVVLLLFLRFTRLAKA